MPRTTVVKISLTICTGEPGPNYKCEAFKGEKGKQSVDKSCEEDEFIDELMLCHTTQQLNLVFWNEFGKSC